jgi:general secretion pathway protein G
MKANGGFTLIELILVTVIIGILAGMVTLTFQGRVQESMARAAMGDIRMYETAIDLYALDNNDKYPARLDVLQGGKRDYVKEVKNDPWGNPYVYRVPGRVRKNSYDLFSKGPDGIEGNEDDITPWQQGK